MQNRKMRLSEREPALADLGPLQAEVRGADAGRSLREGEERVNPAARDAPEVWEPKSSTIPPSSRL